MKKQQFPNLLFVHFEEESNGEAWMSPSRTLVEAAPEVGSRRVVAEYRLLRRFTVESDARIVKASRP